MRKILNLTREETNYIGSSIKAKDSVCDEIILEYKQSLFQDLESVLRTMPTEGDDSNFILQSYNSDFESYEMPPGKYEVSNNKNILDVLIKAKVSFDITPMKPKLKTNKVMEFNEKSLFDTRLGFSPNWK